MQKSGFLPLVRFYAKSNCLNKFPDAYEASRMAFGCKFNEELHNRVGPNYHMQMRMKASCKVDKKLIILIAGQTIMNNLDIQITLFDSKQNCHE